MQHVQNTYCSILHNFHNNAQFLTIPSLRPLVFLLLQVSVYGVQKVPKRQYTRGTSLQSGAAGCVKCFVTYFLEVPLALLGQHGSYSTAQLPVELPEKMLHLFLNLPPETENNILI